VQFLVLKEMAESAWGKAFATETVDFTDILSEGNISIIKFVDSF
jgi:DNA-directed RNA polymerase sigma subunit (sigma70/sigma32)